MTTDFRIRTITWNVGEGDPPRDFTGLLNLHATHMPNLYAIGLQELKNGMSNLLSDNLFDDPWSIRLTEILSQHGYIRMKSIRLIGIHLTIFVKRSDVQYVTNIESCYTRTGFGGFYGNKGGVSIRADISGINVCFVNCHLAAHLPNVDQRIAEYDAIIETQYFPTENMSILDHDYVFFFGDLNFRLDDISKQDVEDRIRNRDFKHLHQYDQLLKARQAEVILIDFQEGPLMFPPTYKFDGGKDIYDTSKKQRKPGWCDRIFWMVHEDSFTGAELAVQQLSYNCIMGYRESDHKPVVAEFNIKVLKRPPELPVMFEPLDHWCSTSDGKCSYTVTNDQLSISSWDWIGLYKADYKHPKDYITYIWASSSGDDLQDGSTLYSFEVNKNYIENLAGDFCLCYYSSVKRCFVGYSDVFRISESEDSSSSSSEPGTDLDTDSD